MKTLAIALALLACASAASAAVPCSGGSGCGDEFIARGWTKIAQCDDHNWSYLLQRNGSIVVCTGVNGRAGPIEFPCENFKGNLAQYRVIAATPANARRGAECVLSPAVTGEAGK